VTNGDRRLVYANPKALDLFGVSVLNMGKFTIDTFLSHCQILELRRKWFAIRRDERYGICKIRPLDGRLRVAQYILVANVIPRRYLYTFRNEELSKQLGISYEHARRLQAGETLPSQLLVEKTAATVGVSVEQLQLAVQRDARKHVLPKKRAKKKASTKQL
jgi:PAS domain-containing protein